MSTDEVSPEKIAKTRELGARIEGEILRRLAEVTQTRAAACMGLHGSTISRAVEDIGRVAHLLAAIEMQVSAVDAVVIDRADQDALERMSFNWLRSRQECRQ